MKHCSFGLVCLAVVLGVGQAAALSSTADSPPNVPRVDNGYVYAIARGATHVYVGGSFTTVNNGVARAGLAAFDAVTGALDTVWDPGIQGGSAAVEALVVADGKVYAGGYFNEVRGGMFGRRNLVAFSEANGSSPASVDPAWNPCVGTGLGGYVSALAVSGDKVYVGGGFEYVLDEAVTRNCLAAFNKADGSSVALVDPWNPNVEGNGWLYMGWVSALAVSGNRVYAGGDFCTVNGSVTCHELAAFQLANGSNTGTVDASWRPEPDDEVFALAIANDKVYAGGSFWSVKGGSYARNYAAAFNLAGSGDTGVPDPWDPNLEDRVWAITVQNGRVFLGGSFEAVNGDTVTRRCYAAAFNEADGSSPAVVDPWIPRSFSSDPSTPVTALAPAGSKGVYLGGSFTYFGSWTRYRICSFGSEWNPRPSVLSLCPAASATVAFGNTDIDVTFNEKMAGVDITDLVLSGPAAAGASVGTPTFQFEVYYGKQSYRFPVSGLSDGALSVSLAPDAGDITDLSDGDLDPSPTVWSYTVGTAGGVATVPFFEDFETGVLAPYWDSRGFNSSRTLVTTDNGPYAGNYHLTMDTTSGGSYTPLARNELTLNIDLAGQTGVVLSFWMREFDDYDHGPPTSPFVSGANFDGVAISADGVSWYEIQGLRDADGIGETYTQFMVDLDGAAASCGLTYNSHFRIRFNHYGSSIIPYDGFGFDDIRVNVPGSTPTVAYVTSPHADGTFPLGESIGVEVHFDQAVLVTGAPTLDLDTGPTAPAAAIYSGGDGTDTLTFAYTVGAGDATPDLDYVGTAALALDGGSIRDAATNALDADVTLPEPGQPGSLSANKDIAIDTTAPSLGTAVVQSGLTIDVTYNQAMAAGVLDTGNYTLSGLGQGSLDAHPDLVADQGGNTYRLTWNAGEMLDGQDVTITVANVEDGIGNPIGPSNAATDLGGAIGFAPEVVSATVQSGLMVDIVFNELMGAGVDAPANYVVSGTGRGTLSTHPDAVVPQGGSTYRLVWLAGEMCQGQDIVIEAANVQDVVGNVIGAADTATDPGGGLGVAPEVAQVEVQGELDIAITFNEAMGASAATGSNYTISGPGMGSLPFHPSHVTDEGGGLFTLTFAFGEMITGQDVTVTAANVYDLAGNLIGTPDSGTDVGGGFGVAPELASATVDGPDSVIVIFSEPMGDGIGIPENYTVSGPGQGTLAPHPDSVADSGFGLYTLTWTAGEMTTGEDVTITAANVKDAVGNAIGAVNTATDPGGGFGFAPEVAQVEVQGELTVAVTFGELMGAGAGTADNYTISGLGQGSLAAHPGLVADEGGGLYTLTWLAGEMVTGQDVTITAANVFDLASNLIGTPDSATDAGGGLGVAPELASVAVATGLSVDVAFNEPMGVGVATPGNYTVSGPGQGVLAPHPDAVEAQGGNTYRLTWNAGEMCTGQDVVVAAANVRDAVGNVIGTVNSATDAGGGLGVPPTGAISIDGGAAFTRDATVTVAFTSADGTGSGLDALRFSHDGTAWAAWQPYAATASWDIEPGQAWKTVHAQLRDAAGNVSVAAMTDTIAFDPEPLVLAAMTDTHVSLREGAFCQFSVEAEGVFGTPVYTWYKQAGKSWTKIAEGKAEGDGPWYTINPVTADSAGSYACEVSDETESAGPVVFELEVLANVPAAGLAGLGAMAAGVVVAAAVRIRRRKPRG